MSIGLGVALVILAGYFTLSFINSSERFVNGVVEAIEEDDYESLVGTMYFSDTEEEISKNEIEIYIDYIKENANHLDQVKRGLQEQAEMIEQEHAISQDFSSYAEEMYLVKREGFLKDSYQIHVIPSYITVESTMDGLILSNESEEELHTFSTHESTFEVGPTVRGFHQFTFTYEGEWMQLEEEREHYIAGKAEHISPQFDVDYVTFKTDFPMEYEGKLLVDGTEVKEPVFNEQMGPFLLDEQSTVQYDVDFPWGTMSTGEQPIDAATVSLNFELHQAFADQLAEALQNHYETILTSYETRDFILMEGMNAGLRDSYEYDYESMYRAFDRSDEWYSGLHYKDFQIYSRLTNFGKDDQGEWFVVVPVAEDKMVINSYDQPDASELEDYRKNHTFYQLNFRDDEWVVVDDVPRFGFTSEKETYDYTYDGEVRLLEKEETPEEDVEKVVQVSVGKYIEHLVEAVNAGDYSIVSPYILSGSDLEKDQQSLVERLHEAGTTEELVSSEVLSVKEDGDSWKVDTKEEVTIHYDSGESETNSYEWTYTVVEEDGDYLLSTIE